MSSLIDPKNGLLLIIIIALGGGGLAVGTSSNNITQDKITSIESDIKDLKIAIEKLDGELNDHQAISGHPAVTEKLKSIETRTAAMEQNIIDKLLAELIDVIGSAVSQQ